MLRIDFLNSKGFTLIELLITIAIIGILTTIAIVSLGNARVKSRDAKRFTDIKQIATALELYFSDNGAYPTIITSNQPLQSPDGLTTYMANIPANPTPRDDGDCPNSDYSYTPGSNNNSYTIGCCISTPISNDNLSGELIYTPSGWLTNNFACGTETVSYGGDIYHTVQIGTQCWLKENLNIGTMTTSQAGPPCTYIEQYVRSCQNNDSIIEKYCYGNTASNCLTYGGLYEWQEAMALSSTCATANCSGQITSPHQGICPAGWHIPTDTEFNVLELYTVAIIGSLANQYDCNTIATGWGRCGDTDFDTLGAGKSLKAIGQANGDDLVGFSALLAGWRDKAGVLDESLGEYGFFWQANQAGSDAYAIYRGIADSWASTVMRNSMHKVWGTSVRCLRD